MPALTPRQFQTKLLKWFDQHGRKNLPWQKNKTPYRVWVSEIMLQQTQVATVIPYFERFMQTFPTVHALANADEDQILHQWAGLGYYSRARNLHRAAKKIVTDFNGIFPNTVDTLKTLPGIGDSTAGAIAAIAFHQPATILDGNVKRVLSRLHGITQPINDKQTENKLWTIAVKFTPTNRTADYTQAIMDLGATLCTRSKPQCQSCPFQKRCAAFSQNLVAEIPRKKAAAKLPKRTATLLVLKHAQHILLVKRPAKGIWGGLWSLPEIKGHTNTETIITFCESHYQLTPANIEFLPPFRHSFTHFHLEIHPVIITIRHRGKTLDDQQQIWYNLAKPEPIGLPKPVQTIISELS